ncbi:MAG TPA: RnfH family protein [Ramlibacter sp.]|jgi:putative ubiquitin-RnfH superfamily antitoxin RatB of RatAB toxin-antitoxin module|nr:RnfH family protein [Ramlibacter sp.]
MPSVIVLYSPAPRQVLEWPLQLAEGATVRDAVRASGFAAACPQQDLDALDVGVWGRRCPPDQVVREGDRVEVYRPLLVDPKVARRERFQKQGARAAGLFAKRRPGAKPGY